MEEQQTIGIVRLLVSERADGMWVAQVPAEPATCQVGVSRDAAIEMLRRHIQEFQQRQPDRARCVHLDEVVVRADQEWKGGQ